MSDLQTPIEAAEESSVESRHSKAYENILATITKLNIEIPEHGWRSSVVKNVNEELKKRIRSSRTPMEELPHIEAIEKFQAAVNEYGNCCMELVKAHGKNIEAIGSQINGTHEWVGFTKIDGREFEELLLEAAYKTAFDFDANHINPDTSETTTFAQFLASPVGLRSRFAEVKEELRGLNENETTQEILLQYKEVTQSLKRLGVLERIAPNELYALVTISRMKYTGSIDFDELNGNNVSNIVSEAIRLITPTAEMKRADKRKSFEYIRFPNGYTPQQKAAAVREFNDASNFIRLYNAVSSDMREVSDRNVIGVEDEVSDNTLKELPIILEEALKENRLTQREAWVLSLRSGIALRGLDFYEEGLNIEKLKEIILNKLDKKREMIPETIKKRFFAHLKVLAERVKEDGTTDYEDIHNIYPDTLEWTKREREVLEEYYRTQGMHDPFPFELTYGEISTVLGLSGHSSNQVFRETLRKLRHPSNTTGPRLKKLFYEG